MDTFENIVAKGEIARMSNFSFCHNVFKNIVCSSENYLPEKMCCTFFPVFRTCIPNSFFVEWEMYTFF